MRHAWKGINTNWGKNVFAEMIVAAFIFSPSQMAELLTNILQSHHNHFLLFLDLAWELSAWPSKSSQITQTFVLPRALEIDHPRGRAPPLVLLDSRKYAWGGWGLWAVEVPLIWFCGLSTSNSESLYCERAQAAGVHVRCWVVLFICCFTAGGGLTLS